MVLRGAHQFVEGVSVALFAADLLRTGMVRPVYHGEHGLRTLRELGRSYQTISQDLNRVMNRLKALYRGWSIPCAGTQVYAPRYREEWLGKIEHAGVRAGEQSCSINNWMDCRPCGERCARSYWRKAGNIKPRNCCARFPASVQFGPLARSR